MVRFCVFMNESERYRIECERSAVGPRETEARSGEEGRGEREEASETSVLGSVRNVYAEQRPNYRHSHSAINIIHSTIR